MIIVVLDDIKAGDRFGKLIYTGKYVRKGKRMRIYGLFDCDCGTRAKPIFINSVTSGKQHSCGCQKSHAIGATRAEYKRLNNIIQGIRHRCYDPKCNQYSRYGARGIRVCDEWLNDVQAFAKWAIEHGYNNKLTLDRIDNNGNYCPENCRWVTMKEQQRNKRNNVVFTHNGVTKCMMEWCEEFGIPHYLACNRYARGKTEFAEIFYQGDLRLRGD